MAADYNLMDVNSSLFDQHYVFYNRLRNSKDPKRRELYYRVKEELGTNVMEALEKGNRDFENIRDMAIIELRKEKKALQDFFGITNLPEEEIYDINMYNDLLNALNSCLQLKEVYERNTLLVQQSVPRYNKKGKLLEGGQRNLMIAFPTYLIQQFKEEFENGVLTDSQINSVVKSKQLSPEDAVIYIVELNIMQIINKALVKMFDEKVKPEIANSEDMKERQAAYKELQQAINNFSNNMNGSPLAQQIYQIYGLENIGKAVAESLVYYNTVHNNKPKVKKVNVKLRNPIKASSSEKGGEATEVIGAALADLMIDKVAKGLNGKIVGGSVWTGYTNMKTDFIITLNIDTTPIEQEIQNWFISSKDSARIQNVEQIQKLYEKVKNIDNSFIIHVNAKNYGYNKKNFSGFAGGNYLRIDYFAEVMSQVDWNSDFDRIVGVILQLTKNAIGSATMNKKDFEHLLAKYVAFLLFDDVEQIGIENQTETNALHVLYLNGIYVPISLVLFALSKAIEEANKEFAENIVKISIRTTSIIFPTQKDQDRYTANPNNTMGAWDFQRQLALKNTKIHTYFLKNFQEIIQTYITKFEQ